MVVALIGCATSVARAYEYIDTDNDGQPDCYVMPEYVCNAVRDDAIQLTDYVGDPNDFDLQGLFDSLTNEYGPEILDGDVGSIVDLMNNRSFFSGSVENGSSKNIFVCGGQPDRSEHVAPGGKSSSASSDWDMVYSNGTWYHIGWGELDIGSDGKPKGGQWGWYVETDPVMLNWANGLFDTYKNAHQGVTF
jgi:hypothetical protein